jgi:hypothetical protein
MTTLKAQDFLTFRELVKFVNDNTIAQANIQAMVSDLSNGHWVLFFWTA